MVKVKLNHAGMRALLISDAMESALDGPAQQVLARAQAAAPVDPAGHPPGQYRDSLEVITPSGQRHRAVKLVGSPVPYARQVEMNHGTLGGAL